MTYLVKSVEQTKSSTGKDMWKSVLVGEDKVEVKITLWDATKEGDKLDGEVYINDKGYPTFKSARKAAGSNFMAAKKEEVINKAMDKKAEQISKAQDRSAWMWAKTNAATLIANHPILAGLNTQDQIANVIVELATKIYNAEPTTPF